MAEPRIAGRVAELRPTAINRVLAEARQLQQAGRSLVSLMRGQPDTPTPGHIVAAAERACATAAPAIPITRASPACAPPSPNG